MSEELQRLGFDARVVFLSVRGDNMVAVDRDGRIALAQMFARSAYMPTIVSPADLTSVDAREAGKPFDETALAPTSGPLAGVLVLSVRHAGRTYDLSFSQRPSERDSSDYWNQYETARGMLAWWRDTLLGKTPARSYSEVLEPRERAELPEARIVTKRDKN